MITIEEADVSDKKGQVFSADRQKFFWIFHHELAVVNCLAYIAVCVQKQKIAFGVVDVDWVLSNGWHHLDSHFEVLLGIRVFPVVKTDVS